MTTPDQPKIGRLGFFLAQLILTPIAWVLIIMLQTPGAVIAAPLLIAYFYLSRVYFVKRRARDFDGDTTKFCVLCFIPFCSTFTLLYLTFKSGNGALSGRGHGYVGNPAEQSIAEDDELSARIIAEMHEEARRRGRGG